MWFTAIIFWTYVYAACEFEILPYCPQLMTELGVEISWQRRDITFFIQIFIKEHCHYSD
jgi:hypothetical protein